MRTCFFAFVVVVVSLFTFMPNEAAKASPYSSISKVTALAPIPITGSNSFTGTFSPQRFISRHGQIMAVGTLTGTLIDLNGIQRQVNRTVALPVAIDPPPTCQILNLVLGPLDVNLLGLMIHLNQVVLNITAQSGGGLLGDLLCSVANLLNGGGSLSAIVGLLNQILAAL